MSFMSGTARSAGLQFFNLETVRGNIETLKKGLFGKNKEYVEVNTQVDYGKRRIDELNECIEILNKDIKEIDEKLKSIKYLRDNSIYVELERVTKKAEELARTYELKRQQLEDMQRDDGLVDLDIDKQRKEIDRINQLNLKVEKDIVDIDRKINFRDNDKKIIPNKRMLVGEKESYIERILQNKIKR